MHLRFKQAFICSNTVYQGPLRRKLPGNKAFHVLTGSIGRKWGLLHSTRVIREMNSMTEGRAKGKRRSMAWAKAHSVFCRKALELAQNAPAGPTMRLA